jgi:hypothetical protein
VEGGKVIIDRMRYNLYSELPAVLILDDMIIMITTLMRLTLTAWNE